MGNCNFKAEKDKESVSGNDPYPNANIEYIITLTTYSYIKESVLISICHWKRWLWESLESRKKKGKGNFCNEGDV